MPRNWNKGFTKSTHPAVLKISQTMKAKKIDNFSGWRKQMIREGKLKAHYKAFKKNGDLAELIGVTLGDGTITQYARTEEIRIFSNSNNKGFVERYSSLVEQIFEKKPYVVKEKNVNCIKISLYQKEISKRLGVPIGKRADATIIVPDWILRDKKYIVRYLRGLYEAEGSFSVHKPTYTHKFQFSNRNKSMLFNVYTLLVILGFHPHKSPTQIQGNGIVAVSKILNIARSSNGRMRLSESRHLGSNPSLAAKVTQ
jgi:hypothetical protein